MRSLILLLALSCPCFGAFTYHRTLTIDATKCGTADSTSFPVLVSISDVTFGSHVTSVSGFDIIFTSDAGGAAKIPWEISSWDKPSGVLIAWVNIATVSHTVNTVFYIHYGDATVTVAQNTGASAPTAVWGANTVLVTHLGNGTSLSVADSTSLANPGTNHGATATAGKIDGGAAMAHATVQWIDMGGSTLLKTSAMTFSAWVKATSIAGTYNTVFHIGTASNTANRALHVKSNGKLALYWQTNVGTLSYDGTGATTLSTGVWYHVAGTYDSTVGLNGYVNGVLDHNVAANGVLTVDSTTLFGIGQDDTTAGRSWDGVIDEVQVSNVARSASWILTSYNNGNAPGNIGTPGFLTFGAETGAATTAPSIHRLLSR